ncbi:Putative Riboflavin synthase, alpha subunit [Rhizopus microsporus]|nr:Putative Riboflavin synthase, alpha subunit [Rhizopus microsporus]
MFTGLVEHMGLVSSIQEFDTSESGGNGWTLTISNAAEILTDCHLGDSIAINGTCLTVTEFDKDSFKVGVAPETLRCTNLGDLSVGSKVNLERAMDSNKRFGGHMVQGHVDTTVEIISIRPEGNSIWFTFQMKEEDKDKMRYIIPKGFICLDGTSLTVCDVDDDQRTFSIMMIAHTQTHVIMPLKKIGVVVIPTWIIGSVATILMGVPNKSTAGGIAPLIILTVIQGFCVAAFLTPVLSEMGHVVQSLNPDGSDDGQGRSYALFNVAFALGGIVGPFLGGYLYKAIGFFWVNVVMGCFLLVCAPYVFVFVGERGKFIERQKCNEDEPIRSEDTEVYAAKTETKPMGA